MSTLTNPIARPDVANLPESSLLRLYSPQPPSNSFWLDGFPALKAGDTDWLSRLVEIIETQGIVSMTTNQTIFKQLLETGALDDRLRGFKTQGRDEAEIYQTLYNEAATAAARVFSEIHARWPADGRVSQEASALLAELDPLVREIQRITLLMQGVGAFTKIPNIAEVGPLAISKALSTGDLKIRLHPNITLVFSDRHYLQTVEGYLTGLSARAEALTKQGVSPEAVRQDISQIHSVNSLFVSRVDRVVDPMIDEALAKATDGATQRKLKLLKGKVAVAQAKKVAHMFRAIFLGAPFEDPEGIYADQEGQQMQEQIKQLKALYADLKALGAHPQRLLIASSGVKPEQPYSHLLYVLPFLGPWSANTMPEATMTAASKFVAALSDEEAAALKKRDFLAEPLPAIPTDFHPTGAWDEAILMTPQERKAKGIGELTADQISKEAHELVLKPANTSLRKICDTLRDKGAASFATDEQATLQAIQTKLQGL